MKHSIAVLTVAMIALAAAHSSYAEPISPVTAPMATSSSFHYAPRVAREVGTQEPDVEQKQWTLSSDPVEAHRKATELVHCIQLDTAKHDAEFRLSWTTQKMSTREVERHGQVLDDLKKMIEALQNDHACEGFTPAEASANAYSVLLASAQLGDRAAAACYASAITPLPKDRDSPQDVQSFRATALKFINDGIASGDWRFVEVMTHATGELGHRYDWFGHIVTPTREQGYHYRKLLRLAATGDFAADLDEELSTRASRMTPEAVQAMDKEAQADFDTYFSKSPLLHRRPKACEMN